MESSSANGGRPNGDRPAGFSPDELIERVQRLTAEVERVSDPGARRASEELVSAVIELYGIGLERIFAAVSRER